MTCAIGKKLKESLSKGPENRKNEVKLRPLKHSMMKGGGGVGAQNRYHLFFWRFFRQFMSKVVFDLSEKYGSTPPICTAVRPPLYRRAFLASKLRRKGIPPVRLPFVLQYASHLYCSTPPICTAVRPPFVRQYFWINTGP